MSASNLSAPINSGLVRNTALNLLGMVVPMLIALVAMPICLNRYGEEQFGILSIAWTLLVTFAVFDLGLGIGTTKYVAEAIRFEKDDQLPAIVWSSVVINASLSSLFSISVWALAPLITNAIIHPPDALRDETVLMVRYAALSIPFITVSSAFRGVLESSNRFDITNAIKIVSSGLLFLIPAMGAVYLFKISVVVLLLTLSRVCIAGVFFFFVVRLHPTLLRNFLISRSQIQALLKFGGWVSVSSFLNPLIMHGEKFLIPSLLSVGMLSYYAPPLEMVARSSVIPFSLAIALLPKISYLGKQETIERRESLIIRPLKYLLVVITPICAFFVFFSSEILGIWLGTAAASVASVPLAMLGIAFYFHAITYIPFSAIQGLGRPELKAKLDIVQTPLFLAVGWFCIQRFDLEGAALAKIAIYISDAVCLLLLLKHVLRLKSKDFFPSSLRLLGFVTLLILTAGIMLQAVKTPILIRGLVYVVALVLLGLVFWIKATDGEERGALKTSFSTNAARFVRAFSNRQEAIADKG